jgi:predicted nucleic acid-binding protein
MVVAPFRVILDANVLFPFTLRDTLLRAAADGVFQVYWSKQMLDETERNIIRTGTITREQAARLREAMTGAFPEANVTGHEAMIDVMPNHESDRHVAAAAVKAGAQVIVTSNLKHFRSLPNGIEAQSPDEFLCNLFDLNPDGMLSLVREQANALRRPPRTLQDVLSGLAKIVPKFAGGIAVHSGAVPS